MDIKPKHIAVICNYELLEDRVGGMDYFFWAFQKACQESNIIVDWFFPNSASYGDYDRFHIIPANHINLESSFISYINKNDVCYTHIMTHFVELCTSFFSTVKKLQKSKIITIDHNPRPIDGYPLKKRIKKRLKGLLYSKNIDVFIGVSNYTSEAIINDFGQFLKLKTQTIYNGVLIDNIIPKTAERNLMNPSFLVVSHLRESKGIQDLIRAVYLLPKSIKNQLNIDVYGDGPYKEELLTLVSDKNIERVFSFKGSQSNLKALYKNYDYLLQPTHMECFSLSILESLAANVPVITTPVGGNLEAIEHLKNGFIFETKNQRALACLLEEVVSGKKRIIGDTRPLIVNRFSISTMVENYIKLLD
ncbi:glycosyltransferase family 4 protein [Tamlana sp. 2_MG-2023]|uniref:glycosyltransferase family 4 protein n=1 Tax=unclassified Tamlana TaxID=2614803 RepID=UPI0026E44377|nr:MULTISPECIES: glycosyltransferase family 4 protein [unclassified Tamlana]MDO6758760.1 glycosyltransferase family 4 protein [Tamlana sp. 2_MG-2023]MDO6789459.1 glycosyltransferase family 4 protein [Tamlana sp. 1_MG-2023]